MIASFIIGAIVGAVIMFVAIRNEYVKVRKKNRIPDDLEIG